MSCGPPLTLMKRTTLPALTVSAAGSKAALLVPSPVIFTSTTAAGVTVAAAGAGAAFAVATAAVCEASPFFSPPQAATPNTASVLSTVQRIADLLRSLRYELVNAFTIYPSPSKAGGLDPLRFSSLPTTLEPMPAPALPQMRPEDLALQLDRGERVQLLDIRASEPPRPSRAGRPQLRPGQRRRRGGGGPRTPPRALQRAAHRARRHARRRDRYAHARRLPERGARCRRPLAGALLSPPRRRRLALRRHAGPPRLSAPEGGRHDRLRPRHAARPARARSHARQRRAHRGRRARAHGRLPVRPIRRAPGPGRQGCRLGRAAVEQSRAGAPRVAGRATRPPGALRRRAGAARRSHRGRALRRGRRDQRSGGDARPRDVPPLDRGPHHAPTRQLSHHQARQSGAHGALRRGRRARRVRTESVRGPIDVRHQTSDIRSLRRDLADV